MPLKTFVSLYPVHIFKATQIALVFQQLFDIKNLFIIYFIPTNLCKAIRKGLIVAAGVIYYLYVASEAQI